MRKGLLITGIILLLIGVVSIAYPMVVGESVSIPDLPSEASPIPPLVGSGAYTVTWSGGTGETHVVLYQCVSSACSTIGPILANESGASGSFTVTLAAGTTYALFEYGTPISVSGTAMDRGITPLVLAGIVLIVIGALVAGLAVLPSRRRAERPVPALPVMPPEMPPSPAEVDQGTIQAAIPAAAQPTAGKRANLKCAHCGAWNEPWLTNCRKCQRTLTSTSS
jgi:ribosomal protein L40E